MLAADEKERKVGLGSHWQAVDVSVLDCTQGY